MSAPNIPNQTFDGYDHEADNLDGMIADGSNLDDQSDQKLAEDYNQLDEPILVTLMRDLSGIYNKTKIIALPLSSYDTHKVVLRGWDLWGPLLLSTFLAVSLHRKQGEYDLKHGINFAHVFFLIWIGIFLVSLTYRLLSLSSYNAQMVSNELYPTDEEDTLTTDSPLSHLPPAGEFKNDQTGSLEITTSIEKDPRQSRFSSHEGGDSKRNQAPDISNLTRGLMNRPHRTIMSPPSILQLLCVFGYCLVAPCFGLIALQIFPFRQLLFERAFLGVLFGCAWPTACSVKILIRYQHPNKRSLAIYPIGLFYFTVACTIIMNH